MVVLPAAVILPCASTVKAGTCVALPYEPAVTAVFVNAIVPDVVIVPPLKPVPAVILVKVPNAKVLQVGVVPIVVKI